MMSDDMMERRIQFRRTSFVLTIPHKIIKKLNISKDQSVRFTIENGRFIVRPTDIGASKNTAKTDKYDNAVKNMMSQTDDDVARMVRKTAKYVCRDEPFLSFISPYSRASSTTDLLDTFGLAVMSTYPMGPSLSISFGTVITRVVLLL